MMRGISPCMCVAASRFASLPAATDATQLAPAVPQRSPARIRNLHPHNVHPYHRPLKGLARGDRNITFAVCRLNAGDGAKSRAIMALTHPSSGLVPARPLSHASNYFSWKRLRQEMSPAGFL
jgi:hypothetical protein